MSLRKEQRQQQQPQQNPLRNQNDYSAAVAARLVAALRYRQDGLDDNDDNSVHERQHRDVEVAAAAAVPPPPRHDDNGDDNGIPPLVPVLPPQPPSDARLGMISDVDDNGSNSSDKDGTGDRSFMESSLFRNAMARYKEYTRNLVRRRQQLQREDALLAAAAAAPELHPEADVDAAAAPPRAANSNSDTFSTLTRSDEDDQVPPPRFHLQNPPSDLKSMERGRPPQPERRVRNPAQERQFYLDVIQRYRESVQDLSRPRHPVEADEEPELRGEDQKYDCETRRESKQSKTRRRKHPRRGDAEDSATAASSKRRHKLAGVDSSKKEETMKRVPKDVMADDAQHDLPIENSRAPTEGHQFLLRNQERDSAPMPFRGYEDDWGTDNDADVSSSATSTSHDVSHLDQKPRASASVKEQVQANAQNQALQFLIHREILQVSRPTNYSKQDFQT